MEGELFFWIIFNVFIVGILILDLVFVHKQGHPVALREAVIYSGIWITLALLFGVGIYFVRGSNDAVLYFSSYLMEKALSVDNLFVFLLIFAYFRIPMNQVHAVLFWGILGAIVLRGLFIFAGIALLEKFHIMFYIFGVFLVYAGIKLTIQSEQKNDPEDNYAIKIVKKIFPICHDTMDSFFVRRGTTLMATPLFLALVSVEVTDIVFALDSIPAVLAITQDPFIAYTSNIFAILGLRSLFFVLADMMKRLHLLHYALGAILVFVGAKMLLDDWITIPSTITLGIIPLILAIGVIASLLTTPNNINSDK
jgi:tellurite resistance protein TerC